MRLFHDKKAAFYKLMAIGFPAGYRFIAVYLIAMFTTATVSDYFAQSFFMISLLTTFSGFAVSSQSYVVFRDISLLRRVILVVVFLCIASIPCYFLWNGDAEGYLIAILAALGYSIFEISRSDMAVKGKFNLLAMQGVIAVCLLAFWVYLWNNSPHTLVTYIYWTLACVAIIFGRNKIYGGDCLSLSVFKDVGSYSISNGFSSGLMFILPMLLIAEFEEGAATELAKIVTLSTIFLLFPKYLSAGFMIQLQRNQDWQMTVSFEKKVLIYAAMTSVGFFGAAITIFDGFIDYIALFVAIQFSQVGIPHANVHNALGQGARMLEVNIKSLLLFISSLVVIYLLLDKGETRGNALMFLFMIYIFIRISMTRDSCKAILSSK